jgi:hypothetical protein
MSTTYREYRNLEKSIIDQITTLLDDDNWAVRVEKSFSSVYKGSLPCICIKLEEPLPERIEVGSDSYSHIFTVSYRIFSTDDGQRLDLAAWSVSKIMLGFDYRAYTITNGVASYTKTGRIAIQKIKANRPEVINLEKLDAVDRYRHLITFVCRIAEN